MKPSTALLALLFAAAIVPFAAADIYIPSIDVLPPTENAMTFDVFSGGNALAPSAAQLMYCYTKEQLQRVGNSASADYQYYINQFHIGKYPPATEAEEALLKLNFPDEARDCVWLSSGLFSEATIRSCTGNRCKFPFYKLAFMAYPWTTTYRLAVYDSATSSAFVSSPQPTRFGDYYRADLMGDGSISLSPEMRGVRDEDWALFPIALVATLFVELLLAALFFSAQTGRRRMLLSVGVANIVSLPIVWFVIPQFTSNILVLEGFAVLAEAGILYAMNRDAISFKRALGTSFVLNLASFLFGYLLMPILSMVVLPFLRV